MFVPTNLSTIVAVNVLKTIKVFTCHTNLERPRKNNEKKNIEMLRYTGYTYKLSHTVIRFFDLQKTIGKRVLQLLPSYLLTFIFYL